jgi:hypothetical protein
MTHTPTDADVERVALAIMAASKAFADSWIDPVAIARAAIAAMPAPIRARGSESPVPSQAASVPSSARPLGDDVTSPHPAVGGEKAGTIRCPFCEGSGTLTIPSAAPPAPASGPPITDYDDGFRNMPSRPRQRGRVR